MNIVSRMIGTHPQHSRKANGALTDCIDACLECVHACTACADACLAEEMVADLRRCIRTDLDCADVCTAAVRVLSRQTESDWSLIHHQVEALAMACRVCAEECERHADMHEHCRICAEACRRCEEACRQLLHRIG